MYWKKNWEDVNPVKSVILYHFRNGIEKLKAGCGIEDINKVEVLPRSALNEAAAVHQCKAFKSN